MFDYPLPLPAMDAYRKLGLGPEATETEISEAKLELSNSLRSRKAEIDKKLDAVYRSVSGLRDAMAAVAQLKQQGADASLDDLRSAEVRLSRLEEEACRNEPRFAGLRDESAELEREIHAANLLPIANNKDRQEYDRGNPPLELLKLADCRTDQFSDNLVALRLVRRSLEQFFEGRGEPISYATDLTREDFSNDFTFNRNLDGPSS